MYKNTPEQQKEIDSLKERVLSKFPLLGPTIMEIPIYIDNTIKMACTDYKNIYYSEIYFSTISEAQKEMVLAHEYMHVAFKHKSRRKQHDRYLWNLATDAVINQTLKKEGLPLVTGCVDIPKAIGLSSEEMYDKLVGRDIERPEIKNHDRWENPDEENEEQDEDSNKQQSCGCGGSSEKDEKGEQNEQQSCGGGGSSKKDEKEGQNERQSSISDKEKNFSEANRRLRHQIAEQIFEQINNSKEQAFESQHITSIRNIDRPKKPVRDWKQILKTTLDEEKYHWSYRRSDADNDYMPRIEELEDVQRSETEVMLDTSGSIDAGMLKEFLRQLKPILKMSVLKVACFDHCFYGFYEVKKEKDIDTLKIRGNGLTDLNIPTKFFTPKKEVNKIVFTDGEGTCDRLPNNPRAKNIIWIVWGGFPFNPCCGRVIRADIKNFRSR